MIGKVNKELCIVCIRQRTFFSLCKRSLDEVCQIGQSIDLRHAFPPGHQLNFLTQWWRLAVNTSQTAGWVPFTSRLEGNLALSWTLPLTDTKSAFNGVKLNNRTSVQLPLPLCLLTSLKEQYCQTTCKQSRQAHNWQRTSLRLNTSLNASPADFSPCKRKEHFKH